MQDLYIEETTHTPEINFDAKSGILKLTGKSYPENTFTFYKPVQDWIKEYLEEKKNKKIVINIDINYLNSSSMKFYYDLFDLVEVSENKGITVNWIYDADDDMTFETGEEFQEDYTELDFNFVIKD